jgi:polar amino acid transport system substrate-binding protein
MQRKKITFRTLAAASVLALGTLTACSSGDSTGAQSSDDEPSGLSKAGELNLCVALSYEPLEYYKNGTSGKVIGWDVDSARALGDLWGVDTEVNVMNFDGLIPGLQSGKCDVVWSGMYVNEDRVQVTDAVPVLKTGTEVVLTKKASKGVSEQTDLCGLKLSAQSGSEDEQHIKDVNKKCESAGKPKIQVTGYPGSVDAIPAIRSGKLDGLVDTSVLAATLAKKNDDLTAVHGLFPLNYWFGAFTDKDSEISPAVEKGIHKLIEDGTMKELAEKYGLNPDDIAKTDTKAL